MLNKYSIGEVNGKGTNEMIAKAQKRQILHTGE